MQAYIVEIRTPLGTTKRRGVLAKDENHAMELIRSQQATDFGPGGKPTSPRGEIIDVYPRPIGKPMPAVFQAHPSMLSDLNQMIR